MVLGVDLKRFTPENTEKPHMMPETLLEKPYLNLYFVNCDDNEIYRQTVRQKIRDWVNIVTAPLKKNQEWLIVYVTKQETLRAARYFNMKGTVFDKIKTDFNASRRDRQEGLALTFEVFNLYEEALVQYDELEASFFQHQANVGEHFLESWIYSSCMSVVSECEELAPLTSLDESTSSAFNAAKGELLDLARKQLDKLGIHYGHLPAALPFTTALDEVSLPTSPASPSSESESKKKFSITNEELKGAIESEDSAAFDLLYLSASQLMEDLPCAYGEQGWTVVENSLLFKYAECQKELEEAIFYMEEVKKLCGSLEKDEDIVRPFKPMFLVTVTDIVDDITDADGPYLAMDITLNGSIPVRILETSLAPSKVYDVVDDPAVSTPVIVEKYIEHTLNKILKARNLLQHSRFLLENAKEHLLKSVDYVSYGMSDILDLGELDVSQSVYDDIATVANHIKSSISFPVDVPSSKVLNTVELIISKPNDLVVGEPCHCRLIIRHSSYWNHTSLTEHKDTFEFFYDVHVGETKEFPITLVPLKTGSLLVPLIRIASPSQNMFSETVYLNNAEQVLVRPRTQSATFFIEQQHRIHSLHSATGFGAPEHHNDSGLDEINMD
ncbi:1642_t:CDS:10 [Racocetra fulgida]|uniref:1642_t:CDS:1 n=1 Tax=Racocetra fulgida TaxID=60492 RepID=A0A9N8VWP7_9GLOM|nr:1642_t:CDS:10 [Racocetra fulgida]